MRVPTYPPTYTPDPLYLVPPSLVAAKLGMDRTHISRILRGERTADLRLLQQIAKASGVTVLELETHIRKAYVLSRQGAGRRKKAPTKVDQRIRGLIVSCWNDSSGRPTYEAIRQQVEAETGVKISRETVRQVVLKAVSAA